METCGNMVISIAFSEVHRTGFPDVPSCACRSTLIPTARRNWHKSLKNFLSSKEQACFWEEGDHLLGTCHKADGIQYNKTRIVLKGTEVLEHFEVQI